MTQSQQTPLVAAKASFSLNAWLILSTRGQHGAGFSVSCYSHETANGVSSGYPQKVSLCQLPARVMQKPYSTHSELCFVIGDCKTVYTFLHRQLLRKAVSRADGFGNSSARFMAPCCNFGVTSWMMSQQHYDRSKRLWKPFIVRPQDT
jgi:hypothetical protein